MGHASAVTFRMWVRRDPDRPLSCSLRFQVDAGKGVLRVTRPGVLIVPPARNHGYEDRLTPDQLRHSQFLHIPGAGRPRVTYQLDRLDEEALDSLEPETWFELEVIRDTAGAYLQLATNDGQVLALGGELAGPSHLDAPDPEALAHVAGIVEIVSARHGGRDQDHDQDEIIEADPESAVSALALGAAESPDTEDVESLLAAARDDDDQGEQASEAGLDALSFADEVGLYLPDHEDAEDSPSEGELGLPTSPPVHPMGLLGSDADPAEESQPTIPVEPQWTAEEDETDIHQIEAPPDPSPALAAPHLDADSLAIEGDRFLVRHLRWDLDRQRMQVVELQARVERLEDRLRQLGVDPDELK